MLLSGLVLLLLSPNIIATHFLESIALCLIETVHPK